MLNDNVPGTSYTVTALTAGRTYSFKVQSVNSFGPSSYSASVSVLAAQKPDTPGAPTTVFNGATVTITWPSSFNGGSPLTSYTVKIRLADGISYLPDLTNCNGANAAVISTMSCVMPVSSLRAAPFSLPWAASVWATVQATNVYGSSADSVAGNGGTIVTVPDAPINLAGNPALTTATAIGITWTEGAFNGG